MAFKDPDIAAFREQLAARQAERGGAPAPVEEQRKTFDAQHGATPPAEGCAIEAFAAGEVSGERITPAGASATKALLYHHGGGYMFGSPTSHRHLVSRLAKAAGVIGFNMDYRLSPEHPYPAALEDAMRAYRHLLDGGFAAEDIVVGGESAGGNLTAALLLKIREDGLPMPAGGYLLSPWLDTTQSGESYQARAKHDPMLSHASLTGASKAFLGAASGDHPMTSPVRADLSGLPPLLIQVGADEVLLSDSLDFARSAALAGVDVRLHVWAEMVHAWPLFHVALPTAGLAAIEEAGDWMAGRLRLC
jgi:monoterpene epsilon-lactone hydrolase